MTRLPGPLTAALRPFATPAAPAIRGIDVRVARPLPAQLALEYELAGDLAEVRLAGLGSAAGPTDGLWRHTCMEVFVGSAPAGPYVEFNLAPDGRWAAYRFSGYRAGMAPLTGIRPPRIEVRTQAARLLLSAELQLPPDLATGGLRLALAAVVENSQGELSYWALRHGAAKPDFHHPDSFECEI